jgi:hypothetical protein
MNSKSWNTLAKRFYICYNQKLVSRLKESKLKTDKEGLVNSGGECTSLFDVRERQVFQIHKFNLNL